MQNPVVSALQHLRPFVYYHTHHIDTEILTRALKAGKSLEIDIAIDEAGKPYIGHPPAFYAFKHLPAPDNLMLDEVINAVAASNLFVVLDCKDRRVLPKATQIIERLGARRCLVHAWVDALLFKPYPSEIQSEPHWASEDLPLAEVLQLRKATGVPLMLSCRGLTTQRLQTEGETILRTILSVVSSSVQAINFNLPNAAIPDPQMVRTLLHHQILTVVNIDQVPPALRPACYLGMTDHLVQAS